MATIIETKATQVNMLHRQTLAFAWQLQLLNNAHPIDLSNEKFDFKIIDRRGNILITATIGNGLLLSNDLLSIIFDIPVSTLDALLTANKYVLNRIVGAQIIPVIQGSFNVVDTFHNASLKAHIQGNATLIQTSIQQGQVIQITGCQFINTGSGGNSSWGNISGNIQNQSDLINYFNQYYPANNPSNFQNAAQVQTEIANRLSQFSTIAYADAREVAAKAYADQLVVGLLDDRGNYDASVNIFPTTGGSGPSGSIKKGDLWTVSVSGILAGLKVAPGDLVRALIDNPGQTNSNWAVSETNIGYTAEDQSNKSTSITIDQSSNQKYPSVKAVFDWATSVFATATSVASQIGSALVGYATQSWVSTQGFITNVVIALGYTPENVANKENTTLDNNPNKFPTNNLVKTNLMSLETAMRQYAESLVVGLWDDRGAYNPSSGNYPTTGGSGLAGAIMKGDVWTISANGTLPSGQLVEPGDLIRALVDSPGNTQTNWAITQNNIGYTAENISNKATSLSSPDNVKYPTTQAVSSALNSKAAKSQVDYITGIIESPSNQDYTFVLRVPFAGTIIETTTICVSGSCTATWKVNSTSLTNINAVSSVQDIKSQSQSFSAGDSISVTISANSSCAKLQFSITYLVTLQ